MQQFVTREEEQELIGGVLQAVGQLAATSI